MIVSSLTYCSYVGHISIRGNKPNIYVDIIFSSEQQLARTQCVYYINIEQHIQALSRTIVCFKKTKFFVIISGLNPGSRS